jgi:hypothetical protein
MKKAITMMAAGGVTCGLGLALGLGVAGASSSPRSDTISFTEDTTSDQTFHLGSKPGFGVGYVELVANNDMQGSTKIGTDGSSCVITRLSQGTADDLCSIVFVLAQGQVDATGLTTSTSNGPGTFAMAITGGTGAYSNARGQATVVPNDSNPQITLHLTD